MPTTQHQTWPDRLTVAYLDEPPFFAPTGDGRPTGCDIELLIHVLNDAKVRNIEFVLTTFPELIPGLIDGRWDVNTPMFVTHQRAKLVDFSRPVWAAADGFIVRAEDADRFSSYESIAQDPTATLAVVVAQAQHQTALLAGVPAARIIGFRDQAAAAAAVRTGKVDASASTAPGNFAFVQRTADPAITSVPDRNRGAPPVGAFSLRKETPDLTRALNTALDRYLGTQHHLNMMRRHGFTPEALQPIVAHRRITDGYGPRRTR